MNILSKNGHPSFPNGFVEKYVLRKCDMMMVRGGGGGKGAKLY